MKMMNVAYGTALYLAAIFAMYGTKATTFKDEDNIKQAIRRGKTL